MNPRGHRGFTLVEVVLALAIFGLLSPTFGGTAENVKKFGKNWIIAAIGLGVTFVFLTSPSALPGTPDGMDFLGGFALTKRIRV